MKRRITSLLLVAMMILTAFAGTFTISAETTPAITMLEGAAIRCASPAGIRFISQISTADAEAATEIGTYIFPYAEYKASGAATPQDYFKTQGAKFVKIVANEGKHTDGDVTYIYAALVNIKSTNYGRDFAAVSYVTTGDSTQYSAFDADKNVRNIREVAVAAYNDFATEANYVDGPYNYKYEIAEGKWSCYSEAQREVIASYDNAIFRLMTDANGNVWNGANDKYNDPVCHQMGDVVKNISNADKTINYVPGVSNGILDFTYDGYCGYYRTEFVNYNLNQTLTALGEDLSDGFTLEAMFLAETAAAGRGNWRGIVDMAESGGFGINITSQGSSDTVKMRVECGSGTGYVEYIDTTIKVEEWYHVVLSYKGYDAENAGGEFTVYVNGVLVATLDAKGELRLPDIRSDATEYNADEIVNLLCIGGCFNANNPSSGYTWEGATDYKVKVCNIFSDAVTAEEVAAMYAEANS
ncbi:MAG: hypothetical protein IJX62_03020 [Clostridia bacterium]|nr:hypothetical protein [Clostridia bacterium]